MSVAGNTAGGHERGSTATGLAGKPLFKSTVRALTSCVMSPRSLSREMRDQRLRVTAEVALRTHRGATCVPASASMSVVLPWLT
jgi:hypothetical protein